MQKDKKDQPSKFQAIPEDFVFLDDKDKPKNSEEE